MAITVAISPLVGIATRREEFNPRILRPYLLKPRHPTLNAKHDFRDSGVD